jgi:hypothetical protein
MISRDFFTEIEVAFLTFVGVFAAALFMAGPAFLPACFALVLTLFDTRVSEMTGVSEAVPLVVFD